MLVRRCTAVISALVALALAPAVASAAVTPVAQGEITGTITAAGASTLTIQTAGRPRGMISALTAAADALSAEEYPYVWGGGHAQAGVPSVGVRGGPGYNGRRIGFDCSGSVAAVLAGAGLWPAGSGVPSDAGVIGQLLADGQIARGPGVAPDEVTLYDDPGVHIFMNIDGRFFGTSDGGAGNPKGGPTWLDDSAPDAANRAFRRYHLIASVLGSTTTAGHLYTFQTGADPAIAAGAETGDRVRIGYTETPSGTINADAIAYVGAVTVTGAVSALAADGSSLTIATPAGTAVTLTTSAVPGLLEGVAVGDSVAVTYAADAAGLLIPHALQVIAVAAAAPTAPSPSPPVTAVPPA
ncbi:MAG: hypothetical protein ABSH51_08770 [Solirubrobacteraceae bacterium]